MRLVLISDSHGLCRYRTIPEGDILVHAGDLSMSGSKNQIEAELKWIGNLPHDIKVVIPGNHDRYVEGRDHDESRSWFHEEAAKNGVLSFIDDGMKIYGLRFYGSPWTPRFGRGWAFNADKGAAIKHYWDKIPTNTDVLITHGPPAGYLSNNFYGEDCGCEELRDQVIHRIKPKVHVFGHIHEGYGETMHPVEDIRFVNASLVDLQYQPKNMPIVVEI